MLGKKKKRINELEELCSEIYQVVGTLFHDIDILNEPKSQLILDKLACGSNGLPIPEEEVLPYVLRSSTQETWGYHVLLDCKSADKRTITNGDMIRTFVRNLVQKIDMKAFGEPQVVHFATHDPDKGGYSLVQLIETSAITGHFVDKTGDFYLDIFSCKPFDVNLALNYVQDYFHPESIVMRNLRRQA